MPRSTKKQLLEAGEGARCYRFTCAPLNQRRQLRSRRWEFSGNFLGIQGVFLSAIPAKLTFVSVTCQPAHTIVSACCNHSSLSNRTQWNRGTGCTENRFLRRCIGARNPYQRSRARQYSNTFKVVRNTTPSAQYGGDLHVPTMASTSNNVSIQPRDKEESGLSLVGLSRRANTESDHDCSRTPDCPCKPQILTK